jgi:Prophage tail length tape measure protein/Phage tail lysozyme
MALSDRESTLTLRANDLSSGPIRDATAQLRTLIAALKEQAEASQTGQAKAGDFAKSLRDVGTQVDDLLRKRIALDSFAPRELKLEQATARLDTTRQARDQFVSGLPDESERTAKQRTELGRLERALTSAGNAANKAGEQYQLGVEQLQRLGVAAHQVEEAQRRLSAAVLEGGQALAMGREANASFLANKRDAEALQAHAGYVTSLANARAAAAAKELTDQQRLEEARQKAIRGVLAMVAAQRQESDASAAAFRSKSAAAQTSVDEGSAREARRDDTRAAFAMEDAAKLRRKHALEFQADQAKLLRAVTETWEAEEKGALKAREALRGFGAAIAAVAAADAARAAPVVIPVTAQQAVRAAGGQQRGEARAIEDTAAATDKLAASMGKGRLTAETFNRTMDEVYAIQHQIAVDAGLIDAFNRQSAAVIKADKAFEAARAELLKLSEAAKTSTVSLSELRNAEARLGAAQVNLQQEVGRQQQINTQLQARRLNTANLNGETEKLIATSNRLRIAQEDISASSGRMAGLSMYQFQNLQYQVNDVVTQLSLGQSLLQTFTSQAGQIFQIFDFSISQMKNIVLFGVPAVAVIGTFIAAMLRLKETEDTRRAFAAGLAGAVDSTAYSADALTKLTRELERNGMAFKDANVAVKTFVTDGLNPDRMKQAGETVRNMTVGLGIDIAEALKTGSTIAKGSVEDIEKLLIKYGALSVELQNYMRRQAEIGDMDSVRAAASDALAARMKSAAEAGINPVTQQVIDLKNAWNDLLDTLGSSKVLTWLIETLKGTVEEIKAVLAGLELLANVFKTRFSKDSLTAIGDGIGNLFSGVKTDKMDEAIRKAGQAKTEIDKLKKQIESTEKAMDEIRKSGSSSETGFLPAMQTKLDEMKVKLEETIALRDKLASGGVTIGGSGSSVTPVASGEPGKPSSASEIANVKLIVDGLMKRGDDRTTAMAFAGNAAVESGGRWDVAPNMAGGGQGARGAFQWRGSRLKNFQDRNEGKFPEQTSLDAQLDFVKWERANTHAYVEKSLAAAKDLAGKADVVSRQYEIPGLTDAEKNREAQNRINKTAQLDRTLSGGVPGAAPFQEPTGPYGNPKNATEIQTQNNRLDEYLQRLDKAIVDPLLKGNSRARVEQDDAIAKEEDRKRRQTAQDQIPGVPINSLNDERLALADKKFRDIQQERRDKEVREAEEAVQVSMAAVRRMIDSSDKTNPDAMRRVVESQFVKPFQDLDKAIRDGAKLFEGKPVADMRRELEVKRAEAIEQATLAADAAGLDSIVKARDDRIKTITAELKSGATTLEVAFDSIRKIVAEFAPKIRGALALSNADLSRQPQTPKIEERQAKNAKIGEQVPEAAAAVDAIAMSKIGALEVSRKNVASEQTKLAEQHKITVVEAEKAIQDQYRKTTPLIMDIVEATRKEIDEQRKLGIISPETHEKMSSGLKRVAADTEYVSNSSKKMEAAIGESIATRAVQAFDTIAESIGKVIMKTGSWTDVLKAVGSAFVTFAAGVLKDIAALIIKEQIWMAIIAVRKAMSPATAALHAGGIVGASTMSRGGIDPMVFIGAQRAHSGGLMGLATDEIPAILRVGEEVLTSDNPRHRNNFMRGADSKPEGGGTSSIRNIIVFDESQIPGAMANSAGERVIIQAVKRNLPAIKQMLGSR